MAGPVAGLATARPSVTTATAVDRVPVVPAYAHQLYTLLRTPLREPCPASCRRDNALQRRDGFWQMPPDCVVQFQLIDRIGVILCPLLWPCAVYQRQSRAALLSALSGSCPPLHPIASGHSKSKQYH